LSSPKWQALFICFLPQRYQVTKPQRYQILGVFVAWWFNKQPDIFETVWMGSLDFTFEQFLAISLKIAEFRKILDLKKEKIIDVNELLLVFCPTSVEIR
jgi:hypothetical protein